MVSGTVTTTNHSLDLNPPSGFGDVITDTFIWQCRDVYNVTLDLSMGELSVSKCNCNHRTEVEWYDHTRHQWLIWWSTKRACVHLCSFTWFTLQDVTEWLELTEGTAFDIHLVNHNGYLTIGLLKHDKGIVIQGLAFMRQLWVADEWLCVFI